MNGESVWTVTHLDGSTETTTGVLTINDGVLWITEKTNYGIQGEQSAWPLTSVLKWERR